jgi:hypothetical protein
MIHFKGARKDQREKLVLKLRKNKKWKK